MAERSARIIWEPRQQTSRRLTVSAGENPTHTGVVVCPGGGYVELATDKEGTQVAHWLNARGVAAFVLTYRLGPRYHHPIELLDAQRALRYVRSNAANDGLDPHHIGIMGFSAGGHLAATAGTHFDAGNPDATDPIERMSSRPDFLVLAYPVISMQPGITHNGSLHNLLGEQPDPVLENELSNETQVTPQTPRHISVQHHQRSNGTRENSVFFYEALLHAGVPAEIHSLSRGVMGLAWPRRPAITHVANFATELDAPAWLDGVRRRIDLHQVLCQLHPFERPLQTNAARSLSTAQHPRAADFPLATSRFLWSRRQILSALLPLWLPRQSMPLRRARRHEFTPYLPIYSPDSRVEFRRYLAPAPASRRRLQLSARREGQQRIHHGPQSLRVGVVAIVSTVAPRI